MTTNKKKTGSNFYEITNVKGKRDRKKIKPKHQTMIGASYQTKPLQYSLKLANPKSNGWSRK